MRCGLGLPVIPTTCTPAAVSPRRFRLIPGTLPASALSPMLFSLTPAPLI